MTGVWGDAAPRRNSADGLQSQRRAMGAGERLRWSSLVRLENRDAVIGHLENPARHGAVILGPRGVGKTTLARGIEARLLGSKHVIRLFGSSSENGGQNAVPYGAFSVLMARLGDHRGEQPAVVLQRLVNLAKEDARGRPIVIILDGLPGMDTASMGVLMQLVLSGTARLVALARSISELPEDLAWMVKDGMLATERINVLTREEVRTLLSRALGGAGSGIGGGCTVRDQWW